MRPRLRSRPAAGTRAEHRRGPFQPRFCLEGARPLSGGARKLRRGGPPRARLCYRACQPWRAAQPAPALRRRARKLQRAVPSCPVMRTQWPGGPTRFPGSAGTTRPSPRMTGCCLSTPAAPRSGCGAADCSSCAGASATHWRPLLARSSLHRTDRDAGGAPELWPSFSGWTRHCPATTGRWFCRLMRREPWLGKANVFAARKQFADAFAAFHRALQVQADRARAHTGLAHLHLVEFRYDQAFVAYDNAFALEPDLPDAQGVRLHAKLHLCDWRDLAVSANVCSPPCGPARRRLRRFRSSGCRTYRGSTGLRPHRGRGRLSFRGAVDAATTRHGRGARPGGYLSPDMHDHPVGFLLAGVFEQHDRARFETFIVSYGPERDGPMRTRIKRGAEHFLDVRAQGDPRSPNGCVRFASTSPSMLRATPWRAAGHPRWRCRGRAGRLSGLSRHLAHRGSITSSPTASSFRRGRAAFQREGRLPAGIFQANDDRRPRPMSAVSREALGLPGHGLVLCSFNHSAKLTPEVFDIWMRLLKQIEGSVLWLLAAN